jgi:hypothetical protein
MYFFPNYVFSLFSFVGFLLCMIPLPWHLEAWNTGTCLYMIWAGLGCLNLFINSIIWNGNAFLKAVVWCDICEFFTTIRFDLVAEVAHNSFSLHDWSRRCSPGMLLMHQSPSLPYRNCQKRYCHEA